MRSKMVGAQWSTRSISPGSRLTTKGYNKGLIDHEGRGVTENAGEGEGGGEPQT